MNNKLLAITVLSIMALSNIAVAKPTSTKANTATVYGKPFYPSDYTPEMTVYARDLKSGKTYTVNVPEDATQYKIKLPAPASYVFFSWTKDRIGVNGDDPEGLTRKVGALYSHYSATKLDYSCKNHSPMPVKLKPGQLIKGFQVSDYYYDKDQVPQP